jgi:hypothetical protein
VTSYEFAPRLNREVADDWKTLNSGQVLSLASFPLGRQVFAAAVA